MKTVLGNLVEFTNGGTPSRSRPEFWDGSIPWITGADITDEGKISVRSYISDAAVRDSSTHVLPAGTVLLLTRTSVGKVGVLTEPVAINQDITAISPSKHIDTGFLVRFLRASKSELLKNLRGATIKGVTREDVASLSLTLPELHEQRRIARILDHADALRTKRRQVLTHLDTLTQSIFHDMFGSSDSERVQIGDFAQVRSGSTPSRDDPKNFGGDIPWVKTGEVHGGVITETAEHLTAEGAAKLRVFAEGSVVVAMYGQGRTRGQSAVLGMPATTNQACAVIEPSDSFDPHFLQTQLALSYDRLRGQGEGGNQPNLSLGRVSGFDVLLPPFAEQSEFTRRVRRIRTQSKFHSSALVSNDELFYSLQSRAFRGEL